MATFKNCTFIQGSELPKEQEERFRISEDETFDECLFIVRRDSSAINFFYEKVELNKKSWISNLLKII